MAMPTTRDGAPIDVAPEDIPEPIKLTLEEQFSSRRIARIPEPDMDYIVALRDKGLIDLSPFRDNLRSIRRNRYGKTQTPNDILVTLKKSTRIFTGLSNNEIGRVASTLTRNVPEILINADDDSQQKFFNAFLQYQEQRNLGGLIYPTVDSMAECGWAFWEWYIDPDVEDLELEQDTSETPAEHRKRVDPMLRKAGPILRIRMCDPEAAVFDPLSEDLKYFILAERKSAPILRRELQGMPKKELDEDDPSLPGEHDRGAPYQGGYDFLAGKTEVETIRYWDERWYCYIVDGKVIECEPHGFATIPISAFPGKVTGTSNPSDRVQGIVHTLWQNEEIQDTLLTKDVDDVLTYGSPKVALTADKDTLAMPPGDDNHVPTVDLSDPKKTPYLAPGYKIQDAYAGFRLNEGTNIRNNLQMYYNRAAMNEVSSGAAPGADVAGYTVNALQTASLTNYGPFLTNLQNGIAKGCARIARPFYVRLNIPISIASPHKAQAWLTIKPNQWDDSPVSCTVSPLADIQKMQITQLLAQLKNSGVISGYTAAEASPMVADADLEQMRKDLEIGHTVITQRALDDTLTQLYGPQMQPMQPGGAGGAGPSLGDARPTNFGQGQQGATAAPPASPTVPGNTQPGPTAMTPGAMRGGLPHQMGQ